MTGTNPHISRRDGYIAIGKARGLYKFAIPAISDVKRYFKEPLYKNSFFLLLNSGTGALLGFVFWIVAARLFPPAEVGIVSALIAAMFLLVSFSRLGFDMGVIRFLPAEKDKPGMINSCLTITGIASLIAFLIFAAGLDFWSPALSFIHDDIPLLISFLVFTVALSLSIMLASIFVAYRRAEFSFLQNTIIGVLRLLLPIFAVSIGAFGLFFSYGIGICIAIVISLFLFLSRLQPQYRPLPTIRKSAVKEMMHFSFMNYITGIFQGSPQYVLPLMVINIIGPEATAYFRIAWVISGILFIAIPVAVSSSLFAEGSHSPEMLRQHVIKAARLMLILVIPCIAIVFLLGDKILWLFGSAYSENGFRIMQIMALSSLPIIFIQLYMVTRMVQKRMIPVIAVAALAAVLVLGITYALIPRFGLVGISIGWTASQAIVAVIVGFMLLMQRRGYLRPLI